MLWLKNKTTNSATDLEEDLGNLLKKDSRVIRVADQKGQYLSLLFFVNNSLKAMRKQSSTISSDSLPQTQPMPLKLSSTNGRLTRSSNALTVKSLNHCLVILIILFVSSLTPESRLQAMPAIDYSRPVLYPKQAEFVDCPARYTMCEATTKAGKTFGCLTWQAEKVMADTKSGHNHWWTAPVSDQARIAYSRVKIWLRTSGLIDMCQTNETKQFIVFPHGVIWWFKGAERPDLLYGEDVYSLVIDEASRVREESWHALRSTITSTHAPVKMIGNVKGRKNWFYRLCRRAEAGDQNMAYFKLTAWDAVAGGVLPQAEIDDARAMLPEAVFKELYLAEPSEDGSNPFGIDAIKNCTVDELSDNETVVNGVDLGKKVDYTWVIGLDRDGAMTRSENWRRLDWGQTKDKIVDLCGGELTVCDATGLGDAIVDDLIQRGMNVEPYVYTMTSKQILMEALAVAIQQGSVKITGDKLINELESFEFEVTRLGVRYTAPEGMHDDGVCALAEANWGLRTFQPTEFHSGGTRDVVTNVNRIMRNGSRESMASRLNRKIRMAS